ncbi:MAG: glycosyltransferase family 2 protein [Bacteroidetes bacterium]|nr:glycosyltransferase family 2 protein [Fibrella sp.]
MHQPDKLPLSVVMITYNAERTLHQTIASVVDWAGEVVLVDSGSTDATPAIAQRFGCRVHHHPFAGYGPQKQFAIAQASHDWVLLLDADECVDETLQRAIQQVFADPPADTLAFSLPRSLVFLGRTLRHSGENRRPVVRLFNRRYGRVNAALVHEAVAVAGSVVPLRGELLHDSYASLHEYIDKLNQYTSLSAENMARAGRRSPVWTLPFRFVFTFLSIYVIKGGFLDGFPGFAWAFLSATYPVIKYIKLYDLSRATQR